jgi:hypothetical protein
MGQAKQRNAEIQRIKQEGNLTKQAFAKMSAQQQANVMEAMRRLIRDYQTLTVIDNMGYNIHEVSVAFKDLNLVYCVDSTAKSFADFDRAYMTGYDNCDWAGNPAVYMAWMLQEIGYDGLNDIRKSGFKDGVKQSQLEILVPNYAEAA